MKRWPWILGMLMCFAVATTVTPTTDLASMLLILIPLCSVYFVVIGVFAPQGGRRGAALFDDYIEDGQKEALTHGILSKAVSREDEGKG